MAQQAAKRKPKNAVATMRAMLSDEEHAFEFTDRNFQFVTVDALKGTPIIQMNGRTYSNHEYQAYKSCHYNTEFFEVSISVMELTEEQKQQQALVKERALLEVEDYTAKANAKKAR